MKIVKPTSKDIKEYYIHNRIYYEQLASYYQLVDPEFYRQNFLSIDDSYLRKYNIRRRIKYTVFFLIIFTLIIYYIMPFDFRIGYTEYHIRKNSFSISSFELPDFMKGMDKFGKQEYMEAKELFLRVAADDENFEEAMNMIIHCDEEIDKESFAKHREVSK